MLNRRYPESTVVETYRLSEWALFMHQLPDGSVEDDEDHGADIPSAHDCKQEFVTEEIRQYLHLHYYQMSQAYKELHDRYEKEIRRGRKHRNTPIPAMSEWTPNEDAKLQEQMCQQMSAQGTVFFIKYFSYQDIHHRTIRLCRADVERDFSHTRCSYVSNKSGTEVGRIMSIFKHKLGVQYTVFAHVCWFEGPYTDSDSHLCFVFTRAMYMSVHTCPGTK